MLHLLQIAIVVVILIAVVVSIVRDLRSAWPAMACLVKDYRAIAHGTEGATSAQSVTVTIIRQVPVMVEALEQEPEVRILLAA